MREDDGFRAESGRGGEALAWYDGTSSWPWEPEDDWEGAGFDYPPPGTRAIGEMHSTRLLPRRATEDTALFLTSGWEEWERLAPLVEQLPQKLGLEALDDRAA
jgi:hypothetical protein